MRTPSPLKPLTLLLVLWLTAACEDSTATVTELPLAGREFLLESAEGFTAVAGTTVRISFVDGAPQDPNFQFDAGCNGHFGAYAVDGAVLTIEQLASTDIGCDEPLSTQDVWLSAFFTGSPTIELDADRLTISNDEATLVFLDREVADPDRPLTGRTWTVDTFLVDGGANRLGGDTDPTLEFGEGGNLTFFTGCNQGTGRFEAIATTLTLSDLSSDDAACEGLAGEKEVLFLGVIADGDVEFEIDAARLTLNRGDVGLSATTD